MLTTIRYILLMALRDKLFMGIGAGIVAATLVAMFLGSTAFLEERQTSLVMTAGAARIILITGLIVFACFHIRQAFDSKEIELLLSRPISRSHVVLAYWLGFTLPGIALACPVMGIIALLGVGSWAGYACWAASLLLEISLVIALALFAAFTLKSAAVSVIGCLGFYVLSRMMAFFVMTSQSALVTDRGELAALKEVLAFISMVVPRLDMFGKSQWLVYGLDTIQDWWLVAAQVAIFVPLLLVAAIADFRRREF